MVARAPHGLRVLADLDREVADRDDDAEGADELAEVREGLEHGWTPFA